jgi:putative heme-binding domain-containing protein
MIHISELLILALGCLGQVVPEWAAEIERLSAEEIVAMARNEGDASRGAEAFLEPALGCVRCHALGGVGGAIGPDLTDLGKDVTELMIVDAIREPSARIRPGYAVTTFALKDGRTISGIKIDAESTEEKSVLRELGQAEGRFHVAHDEIEDEKLESVSLMPAKLWHALPARERFLDLIRFLLETHGGGLARARELITTERLKAPDLVPEYEQNLDHAGLIGGLTDAAFERGRATYSQICASCHGTLAEPGNLPAAPRFATHRFKNGSDLLSLYKTLTYGYGMMIPRRDLVPRQKYEVLHYLREYYLKEHNPGEYQALTRNYLSGLPRGTTQGPEPPTDPPWVAMDYGRALFNTIELGEDGRSIAAKGLAVRMDPGPGGISRGRAWVLYDHDTMQMVGAWVGSGFIDWNGIHFNGTHNVHPRAVGEILWRDEIIPGWAEPGTHAVHDPRPRHAEGKAYGPMPEGWMKYRGLYRHEDRVALDYTIGSTRVMESPWLETDPAAPDREVWVRAFEVGQSAEELKLRVSPKGVSIAIVGLASPRLEEHGSGRYLVLPAGMETRSFQVLLAPGQVGDDALRETGRRLEAAHRLGRDVRLAAWRLGGPSHWPQVLETRLRIGSEEAPFAVDVLEHPEANPWFARMRFGGFDFLDEGRAAAICTWDGDVYLVRGLDAAEDGGTLRWRRIAAGLFQPLGLRVIGGKIHVLCRDQIVIVHDRNGDDEVDFLECFNSDHQVTDHFHEFAMGLQTDADGNFYYAKGGRHALPGLVPQHGTLLKVSADGSRTEILATGFRAPNGVCVNGDGTFYLTDQEGHWTPKNRVNLIRPGQRFYGYMWGGSINGQDPSDRAMEPPVVWITNSWDRSPAELLWVESERWRPLEGSLVSLSYGEGKLFVVPRQQLPDGRVQGAYVPLPIPAFPTGVHRARFSPRDGELYACGLFAWAGNRIDPGGFYRIRRTAAPLCVPRFVRAEKGRLLVTFSDEIALDATTRADAFGFRVWGLKRSQNYGSTHVNEHDLRIEDIRIGPDGRTLDVEIPELAPSWCYAFRYRVLSISGKRPIEGAFHGTIHELGDRSAGPR